MKISKKELKSIILESIHAVLSETNDDREGELDDAGYWNDVSNPLKNPKPREIRMDYPKHDAEAIARRPDTALRSILSAAEAMSALGGSVSLDVSETDKARMEELGLHTRFPGGWKILNKPAGQR